MLHEELTYAYKFGSKTFKGDTVKSAYMKAVKWYATAVISKDKLHGVHVEFIKDASEPKVTVVLWASLNEGTVREEHCKVCREVHTTFYANTGYDCNSCNMLGYLKRLEGKARIKSSYCKEMIKDKDGGADK